MPLLTPRTTVIHSLRFMQAGSAQIATTTASMCFDDFFRTIPPDNMRQCSGKRRRDGRRLPILVVYRQRQWHRKWQRRACTLQPHALLVQKAQDDGLRRRTPFSAHRRPPDTPPLQFHSFKRQWRARSIRLDPHLPRRDGLQRPARHAQRYGTGQERHQRQAKAASVDPGKEGECGRAYVACCCCSSAGQATTHADSDGCATQSGEWKWHEKGAEGVESSSFTNWCITPTTTRATPSVSTATTFECPSLNQLNLSTSKPTSPPALAPATPHQLRQTPCSRIRRQEEAG